ncbi:hypothetical protein [Cupriavidus numazuensis]|uniref:hypothetical protein n=1 Tax=Cupriavidus numazuensis TaxID=221992 RepID=UPI001BA73996|nr:hypothetical protein [Cupriavidus numazuensis]
MDAGKQLARAREVSLKTSVVLQRRLKNAQEAFSHRVQEAMGQGRDAYQRGIRTGCGMGDPDRRRTDDRQASQGMDRRGGKMKTSAGEHYPATLAIPLHCRTPGFNEGDMRVRSQPPILVPGSRRLFFMGSLHRAPVY